MYMYAYISSEYILANCFALHTYGTAYAHTGARPHHAGVPLWILARPSALAPLLARGIDVQQVSTE